MGRDNGTFLFLPNLRGMKVKAIRRCSLLVDHHSTNMQSMIYCMVFRLNTIINTTESEGHFCCQGHHGESLFSNISTLYFSRKQFSIQMFIVTPEDYNACHYIKGRDIAVEFPKCCILH